MATRISHDTKSVPMCSNILEIMCLSSFGGMCIMGFFFWGGGVTFTVQYVIHGSSVLEICFTQYTV